jgi:hypothetical protein
MPPITIDYLDAQRETIRKSLNEITNDIGMAVRHAGLGHIPVYITFPHMGDALATLATPLDPSDEVWSGILQIAYRVIQEKTGCGKLRDRALTCAPINTPMILPLTADGNEADGHHIAAPGGCV